VDHSLRGALACVLGLFAAGAPGCARSLVAESDRGEVDLGATDAGSLADDAPDGSGDHRDGSHEGCAHDRECDDGIECTVDRCDVRARGGWATGRGEGAPILGAAR
jgi:hypothetical protein